MINILWPKPTFLCGLYFWIMDYVNKLAEYYFLKKQNGYEIEEIKSSLRNSPMPLSLRSTNTILFLVEKRIPSFLRLSKRYQFVRIGFNLSFAFMILILVIYSYLFYTQDRDRLMLILIALGFIPTISMALCYGIGVKTKKKMNRFPYSY